MVLLIDLLSHVLDGVSVYPKIFCCLLFANFIFDDNNKKKGVWTAFLHIGSTPFVYTVRRLFPVLLPIYPSSWSFSIEIGMDDDRRGRAAQQLLLLYSDCTKQSTPFGRLTEVYCVTDITLHDTCHISASAKRYGCTLCQTSW